jgi:hypothetical protein
VSRRFSKDLVNWTVWHNAAPRFMADNGLTFEPRLIKGDLFAGIPGAPGVLGRSPTWSRPLGGRSSGTEVPVRIFLIRFLTLAECVIPDADQTKPVQTVQCAGKSRQGVVNESFIQ